jgi:predicted nucleic acid-binding protein
MAVLLDPSLVIAAADDSDLNHPTAATWLARRDEPLLLGALSLAEVDHVLQRALGSVAVRAVVEAILGGSVRLVAPTAADLLRASELLAEAGEHRPRLADALMVAAAERLDVRRIATFDRRPIAVLRPRHVRSFELVP